MYIRAEWKPVRVSPLSIIPQPRKSSGFLLTQLKDNFPLGHLFLLGEGTAIEVIHACQETLPLEQLGVQLHRSHVLGVAVLGRTLRRVIQIFRGLPQDFGQCRHSPPKKDAGIVFLRKFLR